MNPRKVGAGRKRGVPNKVTQAARECVTLFVEGNIGRLQRWLDQVADGIQTDDGGWLVAPNPERAFMMVERLLEYHIPKMRRTEVSVSGQVMTKTFIIRKVSATDPDG